MSVSISGQSLLFVQSAMLGLCLGLIYDFFGAVRYRAGKPAVTVAADLLFSLLFGCALFWFAMGPGEGKLRLYAILGVAIGAAFYFLTLTRLISRIFRFIILFIVRTAGVLTLPLRGMEFISKKVLIMLKTIFHFHKKYYKINKTPREMARYHKRRLRKLKGDVRLEAEKNQPGGEDHHIRDSDLRDGESPVTEKPTGRI